MLLYDSTATPAKFALECQGLDMTTLTYLKPNSIDHASDLLNQHSGARFITGGMSLLPAIKQRLSQPTHLIDISQFSSMKGISIVDGRLEVGAAMTHCAIGSSEIVRQSIPMLSQLAARIADPQVRNRGTLGGSIAGCDPAADHPAAVLGLDAKLVTNRRTLSADEFFVGLFTTALMPDEILVKVSYSTPLAAHYEKFRHPSSGYAMAGVVVARYSDSVRISVTGVGPCVFRWREAELALGNDFCERSVSGLTLDNYEVNEDLHASSSYRANLARVMLIRAVSRIAGGKT